MATWQNTSNSYLQASEDGGRAQARHGRLGLLAKQLLRISRQRVYCPCFEESESSSPSSQKLNQSKWRAMELKRFLGCKNTWSSPG
jgi:hypothetical protein